MFKKVCHRRLDFSATSTKPNLGRVSGISASQLGEFHVQGVGFSAHISVRPTVEGGACFSRSALRVLSLYTRVKVDCRGKKKGEEKKHAAMWCHLLPPSPENMSIGMAHKIQVAE